MCNVQKLHTELQLYDVYLLVYYFYIDTIHI